MQLNAFFQCPTLPRQRTIAGNPHGRLAGRDRGAPGMICQPAGFPAKSLAAAKSLRVDQLQKNRCAPLRWAVRPAKAAKSAGQSLNIETEPETLMAAVDAAKRQESL